MSGARCATRVCLSGANGVCAVRNVATACLPRTTLQCTGVGVCAAGKGARWWWWMMERYMLHVVVACGRVDGMGEDEVVVRRDVVVGVDASPVERVDRL